MLLLVPIAASAHAVVVESDPANGAALHAAPDHVVLRFNVRIELALSRASLKSGSADAVALSPLRDSDRSDRLVIPLPRLGAGEHELRYRVLATDGHTTQGVLRFRVQP